MLPEEGSGRSITANRREKLSLLTLRNLNGLIEIRFESTGSILDQTLASIDFVVLH